uniref:Uncharacterized protein n=1 Tax=viral metagenome TaxID=1070528 RepID=A0A6C0HFB5_9ZZZZ
MKRYEKKLWMFIFLIIHLNHLKYTNPLKYVILNRYVKNNNTSLNTFFNNIINYYENQELNQRTEMLRQASEYFRNRFM